MEIIKIINLALAFLLELCMLAALGYWGFTLEQGLAVRTAAGLGAPLLAAVIWGLFLAPKASTPLREPFRLLVKLILFGLAVAALYAAQRPWLAAVFALLLAINTILLYVWEQ
jgi:hypothetical protein